MSGASSDPPEWLCAALEATVPEFASVQSWHQLTQGASLLMYDCTVHLTSPSTAPTKRICLRCKPESVTGSTNQLAGRNTLHTEAQVMQAAGAGGVPVPEVLGDAELDQLPGSCIAMSWLDGETLGGKIVKMCGSSSPLTVTLGKTLNAIHSIPLKRLPQTLRQTTPAQEVAHWWDVLQMLPVDPGPTLTFIFQYLKSTAPAAPAQLSLVHGTHQ